MAATLKRILNITPLMRHSRYYIPSCTVTRYCHETTNAATCKEAECAPVSADPQWKPQRFQEIVTLCRQEAKKTVLIETNSSRYSLLEVQGYCDQFGPVKKIVCYNIEGDKVANGAKERIKFMTKAHLLVEFDDPASVQNLLCSCQFTENRDALPICSRVLLFNGSKKNISVTKEESVEIISYPSDAHLHKHLLAASTISDQMKALYDNERLSDIGRRLRFFICSQIEEMMRGIIPLCVVFPFGSTVNGFGRNFCDLDMVLTFQKQNVSSSPLSFQTPGGFANDRVQSQRLLEILGDNFKVFLPGVSRVQKILQARVPIIKFMHHLTSVSCDLCTFNNSGYIMAEILFMYSEMDPRVRPLVFTVRRWAQANYITSNTPGSSVTNFQLILLVLHFLQSRHIPILPLLNELAACSGGSVKFENKRLVHQSSLEHQSQKASNTESLGILLKEFFMYYSNFDFKNKGISIVNSGSFCKPTHSAMYIENPLEVDHNVCKNVSPEKVKHLKECMQSALWILDNNPHKHYLPWGIQKLFEPSLDTNKTSKQKTKFHIEGIFGSGVKNVTNSATEKPGLQEESSLVLEDNLLKNPSKKKSKIKS